MSSWSKRGWIAVDLDHTLAKYKSGDAGKGMIGAPVPVMVERVKQWIRDGFEVRIMTARWGDTANQIPFKAAVDKWLADQDIPPLVVTDRKDYDMVELWDDRAVRVERDTGRRIL